MNKYFNLDELFAEVRQSRLYSQRFENILCFKLNNLRELCGRLPDNNEAFSLKPGKVLPPSLLSFT